MKAMVVKNGWSAVTLSKNGHAYCKHVPYLLTKEKTIESKNVTAIYIYEGNSAEKPINIGTWTFIKD